MDQLYIGFSTSFLSLITIVSYMYYDRNSANTILQLRICMSYLKTSLNHHSCLLLSLMSFNLNFKFNKYFLLESYTHKMSRVLFSSY